MTDANLVLGFLSTSIAGGVDLDVEAAEQALGRLGEEVGLGVRECAQGILDVTNAEMVRALRVMTVERGIDPRELALMPFGGAGPLHAAAIAEELGMTRIVVPRASGVLAALGLVVSERRRDVVRSVLTTDLDVGPVVEALREQADLGEGVRVVCELRYRGQAYELAVEGTEDLGARFAEAHERAYGYRDDDAEVELVTVRVTGSVAGPEIAANRGGSLPGTGSRRTQFGETTVHDGVPARVEGPAIVALGESTLVVPPGWSGESDERGTLWLASRDPGRGRGVSR